MTRASVAATSRINIRALNQRAVLSVIHRNGQISRIKLAAELKLSPAAVTDMTSALISKGLVYEARAGTSSTVGRKPILLEINYDHAYVIGVKVSNAVVTTALTNLRAEVTTWHVDRLTDHKLDSVVNTIGSAVQRSCEEAQLNPEQFVGLGVSLPGIVEPDTGNYRYSALLGWRDLPLGRLLEAHVGVPTLVDNDVNALAAAEAWFGSGRKRDSFLVVTLGRGVGLGIVIGGGVYRGPHGGAGELGHVTLDPKGPTCSCGKQGCLEAYLADEALVEQARKRVQAFPMYGDSDTLVQLAHEGHHDAVALYAEAGDMLGRALGSLTNIFAPSLIILSGEGMRAAPFLLPSAHKALEAHSFGDLARRAELIVNPWGDETWARGAAGLAASRYLLDTAATLGGD